MRTHGATIYANIPYVDEWNHLHAPLGDYDVQAVFLSSTSGTTSLDPSNAQLGVWYNLNTTIVMYNLYSVATYTGDVEQDVTMQINIRESSTHKIISTTTVTLHCVWSSVIKK